MSQNDELDKILDNVFGAGMLKQKQYADGKGANTLTSDTLYQAKQSLLQLINEEKIKEIKEEK